MNRRKRNDLEKKGENVRNRSLPSFQPVSGFFDFIQDGGARAEVCMSVCPKPRFLKETWNWMNSPWYQSGSSLNDGATLHGDGK